MPRTITLGDGTPLAISAAPLAAVHYEDEFGRDLVRDYSEAEAAGGASAIALMRAVWAMAKAADPGLPSFLPWAESLPYGALDVTDAELRRGVALEIEWGFFRSYRSALDALTEREGDGGVAPGEGAPGDGGRQAAAEGAGGAVGGLELA